MKEFSYVIKDSAGLHARPAGIIVKKAVSFKSSVKVAKNEKTADAKRLFSLMSLAAKQGETLKFVIRGEDEEEAAKAMQDLCSEKL